MSTVLAATQLLKIAEILSLYSIGIASTMGIFGNIINILVFGTLKLFRLNQYATYLTVESIANLCATILIFLSRYLAFINGVDYVQTSVAWCKLRLVLVQIFRLISVTMVSCAAFDQFLSTNHHYYLRKLSKIKYTRYAIILSSCVWTLHGIPFAMFTQIISANCIITNSILLIYYSFFFYPVLQGLLPVCISSWFSIIAYRNVRRIVRTQMPIVRRRLDRQLTAIVFVRVICFVILVLPHSIYRIYLLNIPMDPSKDLYIYMLHQLIETVVASVMNLNYAVSFYAFFLTSTRYRRQVRYFFVKKCLKNLKIPCHTNRNVVHPAPQMSFASGTDLK